MSEISECIAHAICEWTQQDIGDAREAARAALQAIRDNPTREMLDLLQNATNRQRSHTIDLWHQLYAKELKA